MKTSIWYHTADQQPKMSGYYLAYRGWGIGGSSNYDSDYGYLYYDQKTKNWREYESDNYGEAAFVYYWTDATPDKWVKSDPPIIYRTKPKDNPALQSAWDNIQTAIEQYEMIRILTTDSDNLNPK